jgi:integrase
MRWRTEKKEKKRTPAWNTAITDARFLGAIMQEALRRGWIIANPCAKLGLRKADPAPKRVITKEEEEKIFRELKERGKPKWMAESFLVAIKQGCRMREVEVPLSRIDTDAMVITFWVKGGRFHTAPLHPDLLPLVKLARKEKRKTLVSLPAQTSPRWSEFFELIKIEGLCFHCTRVTVVTRLCEAGFSESQTMAYVGHANELVHALYRKMRPSAVSALCRAL